MLEGGKPGAGPELLAAGSSYDPFRADIWSLGLLLMLVYDTVQVKV